MNTSNVLQFENQTKTTVSDNCSSGTMIINTQNYCSNCGGHYWGDYHYCSTFTPISYPIYQKDEVIELKAWIDGFLENRKLTEKNLKRVRDKLEEFST